MKKQISLFLVIAILFSIFPLAITVNAYSDYDTDTVKIGYITYQKMRREKTVNGNEVTDYYYSVVDVDEKDENGNPITELIFEDYINGIPVTELSYVERQYDSGSNQYEYFIKDLSSVTKIYIPNTIKTIGGYSFFNCRKVKSLTIPESVKSIGEDAFSYMTKIESITIPSKVTKISTGAFRCNFKLKKVIIKGNVTLISADAFLHCINLKSINIPKTVKRIGPRAFYHCKSLTAISLPTSLERLYQGAFSTSGLKQVEIKKNLSLIQNDIFEKCPNLEKVTFKGTKITNYIFNKSYNLKKIVINNSKGAPKIEPNAFDKTSPGIKFYVKNKKIAKQLNQRLKKTKAQKFKIYVAKKRIY